MSEYCPSPPASPWFARDRKVPEFYRCLRVKTDTHLHEQLARFVGELRKVSPRNGRCHRVLDWGTGAGALAQRLHDEGCEVVAVDKDRNSFAAKGPEFHAIDFDTPAEVAAFEESHRGQFDIILAVEVIEHVRNPWDFLAGLKRIADSQTQIVVTTPNVASWWGRVWFFLTGTLWGFTPEGWTDPGHINAMTEPELRGVIADVGLVVLGVWSGGTMPVIWAYNWKRLLLSLATLPLRPFMRGRKNGWNLCFHLQSPS